MGTEWLLGVRPAWDGLLVDPCLPPGWKGFTMRRLFRGSVYRIEVVVKSGPRCVAVDGKPVESNLIPPFGDGREHAVTVRVPRD